MNKTAVVVTVATVVGTLLVAIAGVVGAKAEQRYGNGHWVSVKCFTNSCVQSTLESMTGIQADTAKLTTWESATYVWYRQ